MFYIYGLHLEGDDEIRYVGSTIRPVKRLWQHLDNSDRERVEERIKWVKENRNLVRMKILETGDGDRRIAEQRWIADLRMKGNRLLNRRRATHQHVVTPAEMAGYLDNMPDLPE